MGNNQAQTTITPTNHVLYGEPINLV